MLVAGFASLGLHLVGSRLLQGGMKRVRETANLAAVCMICFAFFFFFLYSGVAIYWIQAERCLGSTFSLSGVDSCS